MRDRQGGPHDKGSSGVNEIKRTAVAKYQQTFDKA